MQFHIDGGRSRSLHTSTPAVTRLAAFRQDRSILGFRRLLRDLFGARSGHHPYRSTIFYAQGILQVMVGGPPVSAALALLLSWNRSRTTA